MTITVIVCTHNRCRSLAKTLESVLRQTLHDPVEWEILVVDNNSKDNTRAVVQDFQERFPGRFRYVFEANQGVSHARNAGIREARGEILVFIDDDETATDGWLQNITCNLHGEKWMGAGGPVVSVWDRPEPRWLKARNSFTMGPISAFDFHAVQDQDQELTDPPIGANMAFKKEAFVRLGGFRTDLGRKGKTLLSNEDTEFGRRLMANGYQMVWAPTAILYHPVEENRLSKLYFQRWWFNKGRSDIVEKGDHFHGTQLFRVLLRILYDASVEVIRWAITRNPSERFTARLKVYTYAGQAFQHCRQSSETKKDRSLLGAKEQ